MINQILDFQCCLIIDRVLASLEVAKKRGNKFGRPDALNYKQEEMTITMFNNGDPKIDIAKHLGGVNGQTV